MNAICSDMIDASRSEAARVSRDDFSERSRPLCMTVLEEEVDTNAS